MLAWTLARILVVAAILLYAWPLFVLPPDPALDPLDRTVANAARMTLFLIVLGYVLSASHLFQWFTLFLTVVFLLFFRRRSGDSRYNLTPEASLAAWVLETMDTLALLPRRVFRAIGAVFGRRLSSRPPLRTASVLGGIVFLSVLGVAVWMRFWAAWAHAALPLDEVTFLAWMTHAARQALFPNGVSPEGAHVLMAVLQTLSLTNPVLFIKLFGPAMGVLTVLSVGYAAFRLTGRPGPALAVLVLYGIFPALLPYARPDLLRQAAGGATELGFAMVLPLLVFTYEAWVHPSPGRRGTALALLVITAFVHLLAAVYALAAVLAATAAGWIAGGVHRPTLRFFARWIPLGAVAAFLPLGIALFLGVRPFSPPPGTLLPSSPPTAALPLLEALAFAAPLALFAVRLLLGRPRAEVLQPVAALLLLTVAAWLPQVSFLGIRTLAPAAPFDAFLALSEGLALALGWSAGEELLAALAGTSPAGSLSVLGAAALAAFLWRAAPPSPLRPAAMASDAFVRAYVTIAERTTPGTWLAVSQPAGYALALGQGFMMDDASFVESVKPAGRWLVYSPPGKKASTLPEDTIFFFVQSTFAQPPAVSQQNAAAQARLVRWIQAWETTHRPLPVFFRGGDVTVYRLSRPPAQEKTPLRREG